MDNLVLVVGYRVGTFVTDNGEAIEYVRLYCLSVMDKVNDIKVNGIKAEEVKVKRSEVLADVVVGGFANLYFDQYRKCTLIQPVSEVDTATYDKFKSVLEVI